MNHQESNVDKLLKARAEIDEQLRRHKISLTILFTDIVGSTAYFDRYGDTAGFAMLHRHADLCGSTIKEFHGRVIKTMGDSVMAEFAEPSEGVRAAVEIQRRLLRLNQPLVERDRLQLRIGLNHGPAFRHENDVYGDAVNLASRVAKHTGPAQILVSRSVRQAVVLASDLHCTWLGKIPIEGRTEKEDIFEVQWTDMATYGELREHVTAAFARGELISPGVRPEDLLPLGVPPLSVTPLNAESEAQAAAAIEPLTERYDILGEVGRGGMGIVYKARDRETRELVALKVLRPEIASDEKLLERFKNELRLSYKITHKNVCRIYHLHRVGNTACISMEFVQGESLRQVLRRFGSLPLRKGIEIARQMCAGLQEAHEQGVVHRDLKPENVMVDQNGNVKLMDFGIARSTELGSRVTGSSMGTPAYMAPEQAEGKTTDHRSDIYSLGLVLYEIFTGVPAFSGDTPVTVALKQVRESPPPPSQLEPTVPTHIERTILKCLEKMPDARFQSATEVQAALSGTTEQVSTTTPAAPEETKRARPRKVRLVVVKWLPLLAVGVVVSAAILGIGWDYFAQRPTHPVQPSQTDEPAVSQPSQPSKADKPSASQPAQPSPQPAPETAEDTGVSATAADSFSTILKRGTSLYEAGRYEQALREFLKAEALRPDELIVYYNAGQCYRMLGRNREAAAKYYAYLLVAPEDDPDRSGVIMWLTIRGYETPRRRVPSKAVESKFVSAFGDLGIETVIARNPEELEELRRRGDSSFRAFALRVSNTPVRLGPVQVVLKMVDTKKFRYTMDVIADDKRVEKKDKTVNEPAQFYMRGQPYEIVVFEVQQNRAIGYLRTPKTEIR